MRTFPMKIITIILPFLIWLGLHLTGCLQGTQALEKHLQASQIYPCLILTHAIQQRILKDEVTNPKVYIFWVLLHLPSHLQ